MRITELPLEERPREKLKQRGANALTDSELLAIILRTGTRNEDVLAMSTSLLTKFNLKRLSRTNISLLEKSLGIGETKACQIAACFELGRRLNQFKEKKHEIKKAKDVASLLMSDMRALTKEHLKVIFLNIRRKIIKTETIFIGSLSESVIHPREIFQRALEESAAAIILVHNHPSGDPNPSQADIDATHQIIKAGEIVDIPLLDHIILADNTYYSMHEKGIIN